MATEKQPLGLYARVFGVVQGVGFRYSTVMKAKHLGLNGYARNRSDGSVEVVAEGSKRALESLIAWLHRGPSMAVVDRVDYRLTPYTGGYSGFGVDF